MNIEDKKIFVTAKHLRAVLQALRNGGVELREFLVVDSLNGRMGKSESSIEVLIKEFNEEISK